jgi:transposase-like protein
MGIKKRKYSKEQKEEIVQRALSGERVLELGKENNISPGLINRWKRQYLDGELINNNTDQEVKKLQTQVAKLEQMIGKLTMENYILKKEKEYIQKRKKEGSSIITGPYFPPSKKAVD